MVGIYETQKKDGSVYYRASVTYRSKHISLGSSENLFHAKQMYLTARKTLDANCPVEAWDETEYPALPFQKFVSLVNFRDSGIYIKNPIILRRSYFSYFLEPDYELKFDMDDLFYYSGHAIMRRGSHLFVADYGMQENLRSRYGIPPYAVEGQDYRFLNGDNTDFRYANIEVLNRFQGITAIRRGRERAYRVKIHLRGDWTIGVFASETMAAVAYNKALDEAKKHGLKPKSSAIYLDGLSAREYAELYLEIDLPSKYLAYLESR